MGVTTSYLQQIYWQKKALTETSVQSMWQTFCSRITTFCKQKFKTFHIYQKKIIVLLFNAMKWNVQLMMCWTKVWWLLQTGRPDRKKLQCNFRHLFIHKYIENYVKLLRRNWFWKKLNWIPARHDSKVVPSQHSVDSKEKSHRLVVLLTDMSATLIVNKIEILQCFCVYIVNKMLKGFVW